MKQIEVVAAIVCKDGRIFFLSKNLEMRGNNKLNEVYEEIITLCVKPICVCACHG